ncbi:MAG: PadR family transcriptional regulator, partial [Candidatus Helarchaeota archaeon]
MFIHRNGRYKGKISPIEMLVLGTIKEHPLFGNEIINKLKKQFNETSFVPHSGTIYPLLERLEKKKLINSKIVITGKKKRKKYELTKEGSKLLVNILYNKEFEKEIEFSNKFFDYFFSNSFLDFIRNISEIGENIAHGFENMTIGFEKTLK